MASCWRARKRAAAALARDLAGRGAFPPRRMHKDSDNVSYKQGSVGVAEGRLIAGGLDYPVAKVAVHHQPAARLTRPRPQKARCKRGKGLSEPVRTSRGAIYVVHAERTASVCLREFISLKCREWSRTISKLPTPGRTCSMCRLHSLTLCQNTSATKDDSKVKLNRLHSAEWQNTRRRAKQAVAEMADELIALYAKRMQSPGYAFSEDTEWQKDFEQHFPFNETEDQLRCAEEIKRDMEKPPSDGSRALRGRRLRQDGSCHARGVQMRIGRQAVCRPLCRRQSLHGSTIRPF